MLVPLQGVAPAGAEPASPRDALSRSMLVPKAGAGPWRGSPDAMVCRLAPGSYTWLDATPAAREFFGEPLVNGKASFLDAVHPDDQALARDDFRAAAEHGERHDRVLRLKGAEGPWHFVRVHAQGRYDRDGRLNHIRCVLNDVTDQVRAEQELRRRTDELTVANEQLRRTNALLKDAQARLVHTEKLASLGTLAAGMAHEVNNPLAFATSNAAVLERDVALLLDLLGAYEEGRGAIAGASPELAARLDAMAQNADLPYLRAHLVDVARSVGRGLQRVAKIVHNLRAFAQLDRGEVVEIDANESLDQALGLLSDQLARLRVTVTRDFGTLPPLECNAAAIHQVFYNLLINAAQAVEDCGKPARQIRVTTRLQAEDVVVEVADDGCGIPADVLPRIFDPFFSTKPAGRGSGLGLSLSHGIVSDHGGRIEVESAPGRGACFRVRLPARRTGPAPPPKPAGR
jgi:PAS domain S-box-containing protein